MLETAVIGIGLIAVVGISLFAISGNISDAEERGYATQDDRLRQRQQHPRGKESLGSPQEVIEADDPGGTVEGSGRDVALRGEPGGQPYSGTEVEESMTNTNLELFDAYIGARDVMRKIFDDGLTGPHRALVVQWFLEHGNVIEHVELTGVAGEQDDGALRRAGRLSEAESSSTWNRVSRNN